MLIRYFNGEFGLSSVERCHLKVALPSILNDPFEFSLAPTGELTTDLAINVLRERIENGTKETLSNGTVVDLAATREAFCDGRELLKKASEMADDLAAYDEMLREQAKLVGDSIFRLICFTTPDVKDKDTIRMWSLYGDSHRGIRMHFEESEFINDQLSKFYDVGYESERVAIRRGITPSDPDYTDRILEAMITKGKFWDYENERRLLIHAGNRSIKSEKGFDFYKYPSISLKRIDVGVAGKEVKTKLEKLLKRKGLRHVELWEAELDSSDFKIHYNRIK